MQDNTVTATATEMPAPSTKKKRIRRSNPDRCETCHRPLPPNGQLAKLAEAADKAAKRALERVETKTKAMEAQVLEKQSRAKDKQAKAEFLRSKLSTIQPASEAPIDPPASE